VCGEAERELGDIPGNKTGSTIKEPGWKKIYSQPVQLKRPSPLRDPTHRNRPFQDREIREQPACRRDILFT
jgi:hypothetical protein